MQKIKELYSIINFLKLHQVYVSFVLMRANYQLQTIVNHKCFKLSQCEAIC